MSDTALGKGYTRGREYLKLCPIEKLTFEEYKNIGKLDVKKQYKQKKAQDAYLLGWWHAGEQFASLFKPSQDSVVLQKNVREAERFLIQACKHVEAILEIDPAIQEYLENVRESIIDAQIMLDGVSEHLKEKGRE